MATVEGFTPLNSSTLGRQNQTKTMDPTVVSKTKAHSILLAGWTRSDPVSNSFVYPGAISVSPVNSFELFVVQIR